MIFNKNWLAVNIFLLFMIVAVLLKGYILVDESYFSDNNKRYIIPIENIKPFDNAEYGDIKEETSEFVESKLSEDYKEYKKIQVMITGLGLDKELLKKALMLPKDVSLGFSAYTEGLDEILKRNGTDYKMFVNIPIKTKNKFENNGFLALSPEFTRQENAKKLNIVLAKSKGASGLYIYENDFKDSVFVKQLANVVENRGIMLYYAPGLVDVNAAKSAEGDNVIKNDKSSKVSEFIIQPNVIIDKSVSLESLNNSLIEMEIEEDNQVLLIDAPSALGIDIFMQWLEKNNIFRLAPIH